MISFGNAASSDNGLIPLKTSYKKRGELLGAIVSKKNWLVSEWGSLYKAYAKFSCVSGLCELCSSVG